MRKIEKQKTDILHKIKLTEIEKQCFCKAFKRGIYKELYDKKMLTDNQLNQLLARNE